MSADPLSDIMRAITEAIAAKDENAIAGGLLGGEFGYGGHWNSDVFEMRPYYWGDCDCGSDERSEAWWSGHPHAVDCYQAELDAEKMSAGVHYSQAPYANRTIEQIEAIRETIYKRLCAKHGVTYPARCTLHCTCGVDEAAKSADIGHRPNCAIALPNFLHRRTGLEVRWYKYIGRDMEVKNLPSDLTSVFQECLADIKRGGSHDH